jgi:hypothetical protein
MNICARSFAILSCLVVSFNMAACGAGGSSEGGARNGDEQAAASEPLAIDPADPVAGPLLQKYGVLPYLSAGFYQYEWEEYARCLPAEALQIFKNVAAKLRLDPYDLYTVAMGEGLGFYFDRQLNSEQLLAGPVDGFVYLGVDFFVSDLPGLISRGLLDSGFRKGVAFDTRIVERNEPADGGVPIRLEVPVFKDLETALLGFGAVYADRTDLAIEFARSRGFGTLDRDQRSFLGYFFYQNPGSARSSMQANGTKVFTNQPDGVRPKDLRTKSLKRVVTARYLEGHNVLDGGGACSVPLWQ